MTSLFFNKSMNRNDEFITRIKERRNKEWGRGSADPNVEFSPVW